MSIGGYREYSEENFGVNEWGEMILDKRKRPEIPTVQIFKSLLEMPVFGQKSLLEADEQALWDLKLPSGKKLRLGIVDGHWAGGVWASVLAVSGKSNGVVDLERYKGRGHELEASRRVLRRAFEKLGKGYFGIVGGDGLYASHDDFQLCLDYESHLLVKTDEEGLSVIEDARWLFNASGAKDFQGVGFQKGYDAKRDIDYELTMKCGGLKALIGKV